MARCVELNRGQKRKRTEEKQRLMKGINNFADSTNNKRRSASEDKRRNIWVNMGDNRGEKKEVGQKK